MSRPRPVRILPDALINQIAAGEVVERPASVVKELVENAVDAGARSIRVEIRNGGKGLIAVRDDGRGMGRDDALIAIERHATSKIRDADDLLRVGTLGFRGEALPSIAQVSRMEIETAREGDERGTHLVLDQGVLREVRDAPPVRGTEVRVRRLFANTPVRLRFLKGERTEVGHCVEAVTRLALAHPEVGIELVRGASVLVRAAPTDDLRRRVLDLLGRSLADQLIDVEDAEGDMRLRGMVSIPSLSRSSRNALYAFVNGRPVRDRLLLGAILGAYRSLLPRGRFPVVALFLQVPPERVDHNVHPTKSEVRFVRSNEVFRFVAGSLERALSETRVDPAARPPVGRHPGGAPPGDAGAGRLDGTGDPEAAATRDPGPVAPRADGAGRPSPSWSAVRESLFDGGPPPQRPPEVVATAATDPCADGGGEQGAPAAGAGDTDRCSFRFASLRLIGAYEGTYLLFQDGEDLVLLDQHAAHERINYERMLRSGSAPGPSQRLLVPEILDLPRAQAEMLLDRESMLASLGIEIADFGGGSIAVTAVPPALDAGGARQLVEDVAQEMLASGSGTAVEDLRHRVAALAACHASVRAHDRLSAESVRSLLERLDRADHPFTCPHGRPILVRFGLSQVRRWFERS